MKYALSLKIKGQFLLYLHFLEAMQYSTLRLDKINFFKAVKLGISSRNLHL